MGLGATLIATGGPAPAVYAVAVASTVVGVVFRPAQAALLPRLARDPAELTAANAASSTIESIASFVGPAAGGLVLAATSPEIVFALNGVTFVWSAALVLGIRTAGSDASKAPGPERVGFVRELTGGIGAIGGNRTVAAVSGLYAAQTLVAGVLNVLVVVAALELLGGNEASIGYLNAMIGAGGIVGGVVALGLATRRHLATAFGAGLVLFGLPLAVVGLVGTMPVALIALLVVGMGNTIVDVTGLTILQRIVADAVLGRVLGTLEGVLLGAIGLGALVAPALVDWLGVDGALVIAGATLPVLTLVAAASLRTADRTALRPPHTALLRGVPFLAVLPDPVLEHLAATAADLRAGAGDVIIRAGDPGDHFYAIEEGEVEIEGRRFGPGESFGEIALLRDVPRTATVTAVTDVVLRALERDEFLAAVTGHESAHASADETVAARLGGFAAATTPI